MKFWTTHEPGEAHFPLSGVRITKTDKGIQVDTDAFDCPVLRWITLDETKKRIPE